MSSTGSPSSEASHAANHDAAGTGPEGTKVSCSDRRAPRSRSTTSPPTVSDGDGEGSTNGLLISGVGGRGRRTAQGGPDSVLGAPGRVRPSLCRMGVRGQVRGGPARVSQPAWPDGRGTRAAPAPDRAPLLPTMDIRPRRAHTRGAEPASSARTPNRLSGQKPAGADERPTLKRTSHHRGPKREREVSREAVPAPRIAARTAPGPTAHRGLCAISRGRFRFLLGRHAELRRGLARCVGPGPADGPPRPAADAGARASRPA